MKQMRRWPLLFAVTLAGACSHDWDIYDPRIVGSSGTTTACVPDATAPCYTGPEGTAGVGLCKAGTTRCNADGTGFGACEGEVTPSDETCDPGDQDCNGQVDEIGCPCTPGVVQACYEGATGTENVGQCQAGVHVCDANGTFGICLGQVIPQVEDCATAVDDDCNGTTNEQCASWSQRFGDGDDQYPWAMTVDGSGNVLITGELAGSADFGGGDIASAGNVDLFVAKFDAAGNHLWSRSWGDIDVQVGLGIAADGAGNIYVTGLFLSMLDFGLGAPLVAAGGSDIFVVKLDSQGNPAWARSYGDTLEQYGYAIATDAAGNPVFTGEFVGTIDFGTGPITSNIDGSPDGFVVKLDTDGTTLFSLPFGADGYDSGFAVAVDEASQIYLTGTFDEAIDFGGQLIGDQGDLDLFVAKLDPAGGRLWSRGFGPDLNQIGAAIATDINGNVVVAGLFEDTIDLGAGLINTHGFDDAFVVKLDPNGNHLWSHGYGGLADDVASGVATDTVGNVVLSVRMRDTVDFGGGPLLSAGNDDMAVVKLDPNGNHIFSRRFGDPNDQDPRAIKTDAMNSIYLVGDCRGTVNFGSGNLFGQGGEDICLAKFPP